MNFDSYVVQDTNLSLTMPLAYPPPKARCSKGLRKTKGFTLAEVLITLTIIGVVAAMTIPTLLMKHQKQTYVTGLKKAYSNLQNALTMIPISEGCSSGDFDCADFLTDSPTNIDNIDFKGYSSRKAIYLLSKQFKVSSIDFDKGGMAACDLTGYDDDGTYYNSYACFQAADGMMYQIAPPDLLVDVNGQKGPNKFGRDRFAFRIASENQNGIPKGTLLPGGSAIYNKYFFNSDTPTRNCASNIKDVSATSEYSCASEVLDTGKMDY